METEEFDLKIQLTNEYLRTGGLQKILDADLLQDIIDFNPKQLNTFTSRLKAFMNLILKTNLIPPLVIKDSMSEYKSFLQKSLFFDQIQIDSEEQFDIIYSKLKEKNNLLFRGQREAKWRLYSNLQRNWIDNKIYDQQNSYEEFLKKLVANGGELYTSSIQKILDKFHIDTINSISVLGFLQHHSCPTPLLDWTYKFQNALFFGLDKITPNIGPTEIENYFSIYFIDEESLGGGGMRKLMEETLDEVGEDYLEKAISLVSKNESQKQKMKKHFMGRKFFDNERIPGAGLISYITEIDKLINFPLEYFSDKDAKNGIIFSLNNSLNIQNQKGVFTWNANPIKPLEVMGTEQYFLENIGAKAEEYRFCGCYNINKNLSTYITEKLTKEGIIFDYIYPTKDIDTWDVFVKSQSASS
jgi:hypothetical protein